MKNAIRIIILSSLIIVLLVGSSAGQVFSAGTSAYTVVNLIPTWIRGDSSDDVGIARILASDFNQDGKLDIITCNSGHAFMLNYVDGGSYDIKWYSEQIHCKKIASADRDSNGISEIYVATNDGRVLIIDATNHQIIDSFSLAPGIVANDITISDVDGDSHVEIVLVSSGSTLVYDAITFALEWQATGFGGTNVAIANIDNDPSVEIVVNSVPAHILNPVNKTQEWAYPSGFGIAMDAGDVDDDGKAEIAWVMEREGATVLDGDTQTIKWSLPGPILLNDVAIADVDTDGFGEVLIGDGGDYGFDIHGYGGNDGTPLWTITGSTTRVHGITTADADNDNTKEIIWGAGIPDYHLSHLSVGNWETQAVDWESERLVYLCVAAGDIDLDGHSEIIQGAWSGLLNIYDGETRQVEWSIDPHFIAKQVLIGQLDTDPALEFLISGANNANNSDLRVYDGISHNLEWQDMSGSAVPDAVVLRDIDTDAIDEIILGTLARVKVFHGASDTVQWDSGSFNAIIMDISAGDIDGDNIQDLAILTNKNVYVYETGTWTQKLSRQLEGAARLAIAEGDLYNTGKLLIVVPDGSANYTLQAWAVPEYSLTWQHPLGNAQVNRLAVLDLDVDGSQEIVVMGYQGEYQDDNSLLWIGSQSYPPFWEYKLTEKWSPINSMAFSEIDTDGQPELLFSSDDLFQIDELIISAQNIYLANMPQVQKACLPLYIEDFSDAGSGWPNEDTGKVLFGYTGGEYRIMVRPGWYGGGASPGIYVTNYDLTVDLRNKNGVRGSYGIVFGLSPDWQYFYTMEIQSSGWNGIYYYYPSNRATITEGYSPEIHQGTAVNQIMIERNGDSITAYANGNLITSTYAHAYPGWNYLGLAVFSFDQANLDIRFDNFTLNSVGCGLNSQALYLNSQQLSTNYKTFDFDLQTKLNRISP